MTVGVLSLRGAGAERMLRGCNGQVRGKDEDSRELANGREKGSSAPDQDFQELNSTTQPDLDGICFWVQNGILIKIKLDK